MINRKTLIGISLKALFIFCFGLLIISSLYIPLIMQRAYHARNLIVLAWPHMLDASALGEFQERTGIKVNIRYVESNDELLTKIESGTIGKYDVIMPTDYMVPILVQKGLLKKIDKHKIPFFEHIHKALLGHYFDPSNDYSIPFYWGIYGLGIDMRILPDVRDGGWDLIFSDMYKEYAVCMSDDIRISMHVAAQYLYGKVGMNFSDESMDAIKQVLLHQKKRVIAYTDLRAEYFMISRSCPLVLLLSSDAARVMPYVNDMVFCIPQEGSFVTIDSFALPVNGEQDELVYEFLNYLYQKKVLAHYVNKFNFFSPSTLVTSPSNPLHDSVECVIDSLIARAAFFKTIVSHDRLNDLFIGLKA